MRNHNHSIISTCMTKALVTATCLLLLLSLTDAFASFKSTTTIQYNKSASSSSSCLSVASMAATATVPPRYTLFGLHLKKQVRTAAPPPLISLPSIFNPQDSRPIILFDGKCNLCNAGVQLIMDNDRASRDPRGNLRVAALQSKVGQLLLKRLSVKDRAKVIGIGNDDKRNNEYKTIVLAEKHKTHFNSAACILIGQNLKGPLRLLALVASIIPPFIRDPLYKLLSRHRKRFFGESAECRLWDENYDMRFVDDGVLTGVFRDPFADPNAEEVVEDSGAVDDLSVGPLVNVGDDVKIIARSNNNESIVHTHVEGGNRSGVCSVGLVGKVVRVLNQRAFPKNVVVQFDNVDCGNEDDGEEEGSGLSFEAHFFPGQLRKE